MWEWSWGYLDATGAPRTESSYSGSSPVGASMRSNFDPSIKKKINGSPWCCTQVMMAEEENTSEFTMSKLSFPPLVLFTRRLLLDDVRQVFLEIGKSVHAIQLHILYTSLAGLQYISQCFRLPFSLVNALIAFKQNFSVLPFLAISLRFHL